jgi:type II secretory pathway pseudopilin PulG
MNKYREIHDLSEPEEPKRPTGYTMLEILGVTAIMIIVVLMAQGMILNYKRYSIEETAVQRLKELARAEQVYRHANDPTVNPDSTYGTFFELQNAGLIPDIYVEDDVRRRTVNAFVPFYRLDFYGGPEDINDIGFESQNDVELESSRLLIRAVPIANSYLLRTYYMNEEGEVYFEGKRKIDLIDVTTR